MSSNTAIKMEAEESENEYVADLTETEEELLCCSLLEARTKLDDIMDALTIEAQIRMNAEALRNVSIDIYTVMRLCVDAQKVLCQVEYEATNRMAKR